MLRELTAEQLAEWLVYFRIEPPADIRADTLAAQGLALHANINRDKDQEAYEPTDFMPWLEKTEEEAQDTDAEKNGLELMAAFGFNGS